jgi:hypothetical protein
MQRHDALTVSRPGASSCFYSLPTSGTEVAPLAVVAAEGDTLLADAGLRGDRCSVVHTGAPLWYQARRGGAGNLASDCQARPRAVVAPVPGTLLPERSSESRPRTNTGRRLSGDENRYQRISPRLSSRRAMRHRHPAGLAVRALPTREECGFAL